MQTLNELIRDIQADPHAKLSAEARNALHGALEGHPWCAGKSALQRMIVVQSAIAGRGVASQMRANLERMLAREKRSLGSNGSGILVGRAA